MRNKLLHLFALFGLLFASLQGFAQSDVPKTLSLGDYDVPDQAEAWDGFNLQNSPVLFTYTFSGSQTLYMPDQLAEMKDKDITSLSFKYFIEDCYTWGYTSTMKLYLHEVENTEFQKNADGKYLWENFNAENAIATTEFSAEFGDNCYNGDQEITFDFAAAPYHYTGKTLVVTIANDGNQFVESGVRFYWIPSQATDPWRSLIFGSEELDFLSNQANDNVLDGNEDKWKNAPAVKFTYKEGQAPVPPTPDPEPEPQPEENGMLTLGHFADQNYDAAWDGFNLQNAPVIYTYNHSGSQVLYTPEQLAGMKDQWLTSLTFKCFAQDCYPAEVYNSTMKVYIQEVDAAEFQYDASTECYQWYAFDETKPQATLDFTADFMDASVNMTDIEVKFDLTENPYYYTGKALLVTLINDTPSCIGEGGIRFYWIDSKKEDPWRSLVFASDSKDFLENQKADLAVKTTDNEDKWKNAPAVQFTFKAGEAPVPPTPDPEPEPEPETPVSGILALGNYDAPDQNEAWDGFNLQNSPVIYTYTYSGSQTLYMPEQLAEMKDKDITSLSFKYFIEDCYTWGYTSTMKLYLHEVDNTEFQKNADGKYLWENFNAENAIATLDFTAEFGDNNYGGDQEITFDFSKNPYHYTGKTLVVTVANDGNQFVESGIRFYWIPSQATDPWRSLVYGSEDADFLTNQTQDNILNGNEDKWKNAPVVKFAYQSSSNPAPNPDPDPDPAPQPDPDATSEVLTLGHYADQDYTAAWDGFNMQNAPVIFTYNHSGSQVLYTPAELEAMKGQHLTSMTFKCFAEDYYGITPYASNIKLYLQEYEGTEFPYNAEGEYYEWIPFDEKKVIATAEFNADFMDATLNQADVEVKFDFGTTPYYYSGKSLLVTVVNDAPECLESGQGPVRFYWIDSQKDDSWRSLVFASDTEDFYANQQKDLAVKTTDNEDKWKNAPAVQFTYLKSGGTDPEPPAPSYFSGGEGTAESPYLISTPEDLATLSAWSDESKTENVCFQLTQDLTETAVTEPIGSTHGFKGHFDGQQHTILLNIDAKLNENVALFSTLEGGSVKNLQLTGHVQGQKYVAALAGSAGDGVVIENVVNSCTVQGNMTVGGIIGQLNTVTTGATVSQCANYGNVTAAMFVTGGIIGESVSETGNTIRHIANYGTVKGMGTAAGLIGRTSANDQVSCALNLATADGSSVAGCVATTNDAKLYNVFYDAQYITYENAAATEMKQTGELLGSLLLGTETETGFDEAHWLFADNLYPRLKVCGVEATPIAVLYATPIILAEGNTLRNVDSDFTVVTENGVQWSAANGLVSISGNQVKHLGAGEEILTATYEGLTRDFNLTLVAKKPIAFSGGEGTAEAPFLISSLEDMKQLAEWTDAGKTYGVHFELTTDFNETPLTETIGVSGDFFGHLEGKGHTVLLDINNPEGSFVGLFGCIQEGSVKNLILTGTVNGGYYVGAVAGQVAQGTVVENIINCADIKGLMYVGGIAGQVITQKPAVGCQMMQCANYGNIYGTYCVGGLIGDTGQQVGNLLERLVNYGHVNGEDGKKKYIGGVIGNVRPEDHVHYLLNAGTTEIENIAGCIANTKAEDLLDLYYNSQYFSNPAPTYGSAMMSSDLIGDNLMSTEADNGFSENYWLFSQNMYPRLKVNGWENSPMAVLYATPVLLNAESTLNNIQGSFEVGTENGVQWSSKNGNIAFNGNQAEALRTGEDVLIATYEGITHEIPVNVSVPTALHETAEGNQNDVRVADGAIILQLTGQASVQVYDAAGRVVAVGNYGNGQHSFAVAEGIYVVRIGHETFKVCVR